MNNKISCTRSPRGDGPLKQPGRAVFLKKTHAVCSWAIEPWLKPSTKPRITTDLQKEFDNLLYNNTIFIGFSLGNQNHSFVIPWMFYGVISHPLLIKNKRHEKKNLLEKHMEPVTRDRSTLIEAWDSVEMIKTKVIHLSYFKIQNLNCSNKLDGK